MLRRSLVLCAVLSFVPLRARADAGDPPISAASRQTAPREEPAPPEEPAPSEEPARPEQATPRARRAPMRDIDLAEGIVSGVVSAGVVAAAFVPYPVNLSPQWRGGILFDDAARDAWALGSASDRALASSVSDGLVGGLILAPVLLDAVLTAWLVRGDAELMGRMLLVTLQAHAFAQGLTAIFKHAVARERPYVRGCREDPQRQHEDPSCGSSADPDIEPLSFFSGHSSLAFTSAALICLHHTELGLLGPEGDATACVTGMALASTVGVLRILADRHYASDVIVGAGVGVLSGWLVPWLLHFDVADAAGIEDASATVAPMVDGDRIGVQVLGVF